VSTTEQTITNAEKYRLISGVVGPVREEFGHPRFTELSGKGLRGLIDGDVEPSCMGINTSALLAFLDAHPRFAAHGYIDNRKEGEQAFIVIEGVATEKVKLTRKEIYAFVNLFHRADELRLGDDGACAWFD